MIIRLKKTKNNTKKQFQNYSFIKKFSSIHYQNITRKEINKIGLINKCNFASIARRIIEGPTVNNLEILEKFYLGITNYFIVEEAIGKKPARPLSTRVPLVQ